jgi:hypothetical protein
MDKLILLKDLSLGSNAAKHLFFYAIMTDNNSNIDNIMQHYEAQLIKGSIAELLYSKLPPSLRTLDALVESVRTIQQRLDSNDYTAQQEMDVQLSTLEARKEFALVETSSGKAEVAHGFRKLSFQRGNEAANQRIATILGDKIGTFIPPRLACLSLPLEQQVTLWEKVVATDDMPTSFAAIVAQFQANTELEFVNAVPIATIHEGERHLMISKSLPLPALLAHWLKRQSWSPPQLIAFLLPLYNSLSGEAKAATRILWNWAASFATRTAQGHSYVEEPWTTIHDNGDYLDALLQTRYGHLAFEIQPSPTVPMALLDAMFKFQPAHLSASVPPETKAFFDSHEMQSIGAIMDIVPFTEVDLELKPFWTSFGEVRPRLKTIESTRAFLENKLLPPKASGPEDPSYILSTALVKSLKAVNLLPTVQYAERGSGLSIYSVPPVLHQQEANTARLDFMLVEQGEDTQHGITKEERVLQRDQKGRAMTPRTLHHFFSYLNNFIFLLGKLDLSNHHRLIVALKQIKTNSYQVAEDYWFAHGYPAMQLWYVHLGIIDFFASGNVLDLQLVAQDIRRGRGLDLRTTIRELQSDIGPDPHHQTVHVFDPNQAQGRAPAQNGAGQAQANLPGIRSNPSSFAQAAAKLFAKARAHDSKATLTRIAKSVRPPTTVSALLPQAVRSDASDSCATFWLRGTCSRPRCDYIHNYNLNVLSSDPALQRFKTAVEAFVLEPPAARQRGAVGGPANNV